MSDDNLPRVHAPIPQTPDVPTVPRGSGEAIGEDAELQSEHIAPEGALTVDHTAAARATEEGLSPYGGLAPDRPNRSTLDNSPDDGVVDNNY